MLSLHADGVDGDDGIDAAFHFDGEVVVVVIVVIVVVVVVVVGNSVFQVPIAQGGRGLVQLQLQLRLRLRRLRLRHAPTARACGARLQRSPAAQGLQRTPRARAGNARLARTAGARLRRAPAARIQETYEFMILFFLIENVILMNVCH